MRRLAVVVVALAILLALGACSSGGVTLTTVGDAVDSTGSSPVTVQPVLPTTTLVPSTVTTLAPSARESKVVSTKPLGVIEVGFGRAGSGAVDSGDMAYVSPGLFVFPDGRWRVVYVVGGVNYMTGSVSETSVRMATCIDAECESVEAVELLATAPFMAVVGDHSQFAGNWVSFDADGTPYFLWNGFDDLEPEPAFGLAACTDPSCAQVRTVDLPLWSVAPGEPEEYYFNTSLGVSPSGKVAITYFHSAGPEQGRDSSVRIAYCDPSLACGDLDEGIVVFDIPGHVDESGDFLWDWVPNHLTLGFGPTSLPTLAYSWAFDGQGEWVLSCLDHDCATTTEPVLVAEHLQTGWPAQVLAMSNVGIAGGLLIAYESMGFDGPGEVGVSSCYDRGMGPVCLFDEVANYSLVDLAAGSFAPFATAIGNDGLARIVSTSTSGIQYTRCLHDTCSEAITTPTDIEAKALTLAIAENGEALVGFVDETGVHVIRLP